MKTLKILGIVLLFAGAFIWQSCEDLEKFEPLGENSIADATPPSADFSYSNGVTVDDFLVFTFANLSSSATSYAWDFGDGNTSTDLDPVNVYPDEGTYTVTLTASDDLGVVSTATQTIEVIEPDEPLVPDPLIVNAEFVKLPKSSGSDCACSGWINRGLGEQGESSTADGADVIKFDNAEPDHAYQEFAVVPNGEYQIEISVRHSNLVGAEMLPSSLEIRVLAGSGYVDGYSPTYYTDTALMPQGNSDTGLWGYQSVAQMEDPDNNLSIDVLDNPGDDSYITYTLFFNAGANDSVALFIRGIGNADPEDPNDFAMYGYASGEEEIRAAYVVITAIND
ncbi:PKD domain-containing protein [Ichthyenterobacterium sp. W332]|uniref:PKD domain-containing protein n=1 Tax=Microcosmobacter mediterraneus TaxID=3075607 RepID=A0ABU2YMA1_9FLAO|nr:PKD domain-containing protein [Ichthyenterobacterium sp. W332]MDT0558945.1 PKD domain-containing protein [Ichthyenterobacterium sp. W332]